jgi:hypothetical protein
LSRFAGVSSLCQLFRSYGRTNQPSISQLEFHSAEAVGTLRNVRPPRHFVFESF